MQMDIKMIFPKQGKKKQKNPTVESVRPTVQLNTPTDVEVVNKKKWNPIKNVWVTLMKYSYAG